MSHIENDYFEAHPASPLFVEIATYLGVDLSAWEFADGMEGTVDDLRYLNVIYVPTNANVKDKGYTLYGVFIVEDGEWKVQQFGTNNQDCGLDCEC